MDIKAALIILVLLTVVIFAFARLIAAIFSSEVRSRIRRHPIIHAIWLIGGIIPILLLYPINNTGNPISLKSLAARSERGLVTAMKGYYTEYERWPLQSSTNEDHMYRTDYRQLIETLTGKSVSSNENPRHIPFYEASPRDLSAAGLYVDPWGHSYHVIADWNYDSEITVGTNRIPAGVVIWSNGPNGKNEFCEGDDITSWK